jgi:methionyl-tRNA formyltransferase
VDCPPIKKFSQKNKIKVFQPSNLRDTKLVDEIKKIRADLFVVAAYGKILPSELLDIPKHGAINIHASLLPKYRGASPVQCGILAGEKETGVTLIRMNEKMDEGDILAQAKTEIEEKETTKELMDKLGTLGAETVVKFVPEWIRGKMELVPQDHDKASYCAPIRREDGKIDWNSSAKEIFRKWRAYFPWPGIHTSYKGKRLKLNEVNMISGIETGEKPGKIVKYSQDIAVQTKKGLIVLKKIQLEGRKETSASDFSRGDQRFVGGELK